MYIKSVHIDGFKSYGKKVEVNGFDRQFNAITGLNGTGKSNILDAICFVLGISNLSHVRVTSLQELIFKNGQAGVNTATVTLTFDNRDAENSPPGYELVKEVTVSRQVVMGGKNKYWINGCVVPNKKVQDLFCSIQLNINNPHFLIMQGRVTKVLNMKPREILAMLEEASGTRMYETKKIAVESTLARKNVKFEELNAIISEDISPRLEKLKKERQSYMDYTRIEQELVQMRNLFEAFVFYASERLAGQAQTKLEKYDAELVVMQTNITNNEAQIEELAEIIANMIKQAQKDSSGEYERLENEVKNKEKFNVKSAAAIKAAADNVSAEQKKLEQLRNGINDDEKELQTKKNDMAKVEKCFERLKATDEKDAEAYNAAQKKYEFICAGMEVNESGKAQTLQEQLIAAKEEVSTHSIAITVARKQLEHCQRDLTVKEAATRKSSGNDYNTAKSNEQTLRKEIARLQATSEKLNYSESAIDEMKQRVNGVSGQMRQDRSAIEEFEARRPQATFSYRDPTANFDRREVFGMVCRLFTLTDYKYGLALETAAGGRLFNIICANEKVSKQILEHGQLQNRVTFLPLNKMQGGRINAKEVHLAQQLVGADNVVPALELIRFDAHLKTAMEYVFGQVFICKDLSVAKRVTFHPEIRRRCVTLDGDVTDPGGTLSGGAPSRSAPLLAQLKAVFEAENRLKSLDGELQPLQHELGAKLKVQEEFQMLQHRLEMKQIELRNVELTLQQTSYHQLVQEVDECRQKINELKTQIAESQKIESAAQSRIRMLEENLKDADGYRERTLKQAEAEMKRAKQQAERSKSAWEQREAECETLKFEMVELEKMIGGSRAQIAGLEAEIDKLQKEHANLNDEFSGHADELQAMQVRLKAEKSAVSAKNKEVGKKNELKERLQAQIGEFKLEIQKHEHVMKKQRDEVNKAIAKREETAKRVQKIDKNVMNDGAAMNDSAGETLRKRIARAEETRQQLGRNINVNAQKMFEHEESHHSKLVNRKRIIDGDRKRLRDVIKGLDTKKQEALTLAFNQVKKDFGSIFSTLLPGAGATLMPLPSKTILDGIEIKVSLGGIWKDNLTELSGGQRSLAALSLILSMLLFKPAPLYILDEVDAALDLSHTQNIGAMLREHFTQSQFIVVSLKEGMFSNANVLFQTKFIDGVSAVSRTVNKSAI